MLCLGCSRLFSQNCLKSLPHGRWLTGGVLGKSGLWYDELEASEKGIEAPPVVIAHGMLGSASNWTTIARHVNQRTDRRVVTFDARNHGSSVHSTPMTYETMADDLRRLLADDLGVERATLVGHSMGGRTVMLVALQTPEMVEKLIPVDISPIDEESPEYTSMDFIFEALLAVKFPDASVTSMSQARKEIDAQLADFGVLSLESPMLRAWLLMNLKQCDDKTFAWKFNVENIYSAYKNHFSEFRTPKDAVFEGPTVFIGGALSFYIPKNHHEAIRRLFPTAKFEYVAGAGHWVHSEKPKEFLAKLDKYL